LKAAGTSFNHKSRAGLTWESAEMMRSVAMDPVSSVGRVSEDPAVDQAVARAPVGRIHIRGPTYAGMKRDSRT
jgi:hypothetical protein